MKAIGIAIIITVTVVNFMLIKNNSMIENYKNNIKVRQKMIESIK